jgi:membrane protein
LPSEEEAMRVRPEVLGRDASHPAAFTAPAWRAVLRRTWEGIGEDHLSIVAAGVAFYGVFSIFPGIAGLIAIYGIVADPVDVRASLQAMAPLLPADVHRILAAQVEDIIGAGTGTLGLTTLLSVGLALWTARAGVMALIEGLNVVYREQDQRSLVMQYLWALALTLVLVAFAVVVLFAVVALPVVLHFSDLGALGGLLAQVTPLIVLGLALIFVIGGLYRYGPHRAPARKRWLTLGALVASVGWVIVSLGLSYYFTNIADFNRVYGSLGAIVGLMFWMWASAFVVLLGASLNAAMELQTARDTTTGPERPMGRRGAYVADNVE